MRVFPTRLLGSMPRVVPHTMIGNIHLGEAVQRIAAVTEGHHPRRRHEAKRGEDRQSHRNAKASTFAERFKHGPSLLLKVPRRKLAALREAR